MAGVYRYRIVPLKRATETSTKTELVDREFEDVERDLNALGEEGFYPCASNRVAIVLSKYTPPTEDEPDEPVEPPGDEP